MASYMIRDIDRKTIRAFRDRAHASGQRPDAVLRDFMQGYADAAPECTCDGDRLATGHVTHPHEAHCPMSQLGGA